MTKAFWARTVAFGLVLLVVITTVLVVKVNSFEIGLMYLALLAGIVTVGLITNPWAGLIVSLISVFLITPVNGYIGVYAPQTGWVNTATELIALLLVGPIAGWLGKIIGQIQHQADHWLAQTEAHTVHDKTFGTLKPAWALIRLKEELIRAAQFDRPLSVVVLQLKPEPNGSTIDLPDRIAVLQAIIRLGRALTQPPAVITCFAADQVLLILPEHTWDHAQRLGQRLSAQLANVIYFPDQESKSLGRPLSQWGQVDVGVASLDGHETTAEMLITQARAKVIEKSIEHPANGKNGTLIQDKTFNQKADMRWLSSISSPSSDK